MVGEITFAMFMLSLTVLVIFIIPVVYKFRETLKGVNRTLDVVNEDLPDILANVHDVTDSVNSASKKIDKVVGDISELEQLILTDIKAPLQNIAKAITMLLQLTNKLFDRRKK